MYVMNYRIKAGKYEVRAVEKITVKKSVETLSDTAVIVIPGTYMNVRLDVKDKLHVGDTVSIDLGYDGNLNHEFSGFIKSIETNDASVTLECEDGLYLWRRSVANKEYKSVTLKSLLESIAKDIDASFKISCSYEFGYDKFVVFRQTGYDVLKKIRDEIKADIYFEENTLHIHPPYEFIKNEKPVIFDMTRNIEKADLKYVKAADKNVEVKVSLIKPNGVKKIETHGRPGGTVIEKTIYGASEGKLKEVAKSILNIWNYDGYEGSITGWLLPFVEPAYRVKIIDFERAETKNEQYYVTATETSFSSAGGQRKVIIGKRLQ
jgi:hypothetical protein